MVNKKYFLGQSVPNQLHNIKRLECNALMLSSPDTTNIANVRFNSQVCQKSQKLNYDICDEIVPMDIDSICNNSKTEQCLGVVEKMDVDTECDNYKTQRLTSLDGILKKRKCNTESIILSEKEFLKNNTQINPIVCEKNEFRCNSCVLVALSLILLCFGLWYFQDEIIFVNHDIQLKNLQRELLEQVYDQKGPVSIIVRSLELRGHWASKIKIIGFIGSSGVGKTFVANILKKHFHSGLVHELYGMQLAYKGQWDNILHRLKSCCLNLIIIENLNKKDTTAFFELVHSLPKNKYILVISIFSIQYADHELNYFINYNDISEIRDEFDHSNLFYELAVFNQFNTHQIKDWLEKQLKVQNIPFSDKLLHNILFNHNASYEGFKGLHSKLLLELERKN